jgi:hypothetical protein
MVKTLVLKGFSYRKTIAVWELLICTTSTVKVKVKQSLFRPRGLHKVEASRISRQLAHESGKVVTPGDRPPLPPGCIPGTLFF